MDRHGPFLFSLSCAPPPPPPPTKTFFVGERGNVLLLFFRPVTYLSLRQGPLPIRFECETSQGRLLSPTAMPSKCCRFFCTNPPLIEPASPSRSPPMVFPHFFFPFLDLGTVKMIFSGNYPCPQHFHLTPLIAPHFVHLSEPFSVQLILPSPPPLIPKNLPLVHPRRYPSPPGAEPPNLQRRPLPPSPLPRVKIPLAHPVPAAFHFKHFSPRRA